jgi:hypothetical protein
MYGLGELMELPPRYHLGAFKKGCPDAFKQGASFCSVTTSSLNARQYCSAHKHLPVPAVPAQRSTAKTLKAPPRSSLYTSMGTGTSTLHPSAHKQSITHTPRWS